MAVVSKFKDEMDQKLEELHKETVDIRAKRKHIQSWVDFFRKNDLQQPREDPTEWLHRADDILSDYTSIKRDYEEEENQIIPFERRIFFQKRAKDTLHQTRKLNSEAPELTANATTEETSNSNPNKDPLVAFWQHLNETSVGKIGVWGSVGGGELSILKSFYKEAYDEKIFNEYMYVDVSQKLDIRGVQEQILKRLSLPQKEDASTEVQATTIFTALRGERYFLALDDIHEGLQFEKIGFPNPTPENGCKVVFASSSEHVCARMGTDRSIVVDPSSMKLAWQQFCERDNKAIFLDPGRRAIADKIFQMYKDSSTALETIGRELVRLSDSENYTASERKTENWNWVLYTLEKSLEQNQVKNGYLSVPYELLCIRGLKDYFLYCSLFPKGYSISREELIRYWTAEGSEGEDEDDRRSCIDELIRINMLERSNNNPEAEVKMDDLVREFVLETMGPRFLVEADRPLITFKEQFKKAEIVSLMKNSKIESLEEVTCCPELQTLILRESTCLKRISDKFFHCQALRVFDLSHTDIKEIPPSIGNLSELGYLDLSFTKIKSLPEEMRLLVKLKHLGLEGTENLTSLPGEMLSALLNIVVLNMFDSYSKWEVNESKDNKERASIEQLEVLASKNLQDIGITICRTPVLARFLALPSLASSTRGLILNLEDSDLKTFQLSSPIRNIRKLTISDSRTLEKLMIGCRGEEGDLSLEVLKLTSLHETRIVIGEGVVPHDYLSNLREINIGFCYKIKDVTWVSQLENLQHLQLESCPNMESVIIIGNQGKRGEYGERSRVFQKLKTMVLSKLPSLKLVCGGILKFPYLESLKVVGCPQLRALPLGSNSAKSSMKKITCEKPWWMNLEWDDERAKFRLHKYFREA